MNRAFTVTCCCSLSAPISSHRSSLRSIDAFFLIVASFKRRARHRKSPPPVRLASPPLINCVIAPGTCSKHHVTVTFARIVFRNGDRLGHFLMTRIPSHGSAVEAADCHPGTLSSFFARERVISPPERNYPVGLVDSACSPPIHTDVLIR